MSSLMQLGTVRKQDDPILNTQTNPIAFEEKMTQMEEGEKGAPTPSFEHYAKEEFMTDPPVGQDQEEETFDFWSVVPQDEKSIPEDLGEPDQELDDQGWWFE